MTKPRKVNPRSEVQEYSTERENWNDKRYLTLICIKFISNNYSLTGCSACFSVFK